MPGRSVSSRSSASVGGGARAAGKQSRNALYSVVDRRVRRHPTLAASESSGDAAAARKALDALAAALWELISAEFAEFVPPEDATPRVTFVEE